MPTPSRMRSIRQTANEYRQCDTNTGVNEHFLRQLVARNAIAYVKAGRKYLLNLETLEAYLNKGVTGHGVSDDKEVK
jgi:excisionase family DNA binding protein